MHVNVLGVYVPADSDVTQASDESPKGGLRFKDVPTTHPGWWYYLNMDVLHIELYCRKRFTIIRHW